MHFQIKTMITDLHNYERKILAIIILILHYPLFLSDILNPIVWIEVIISTLINTFIGYKILRNNWSVSRFKKYFNSNTKEGKVNSIFIVINCCIGIIVLPILYVFAYQDFWKEELNRASGNFILLPILNLMLLSLIVVVLCLMSFFLLIPGTIIASPFWAIWWGYRRFIIKDDHISLFKTQDYFVMRLLRKSDTKSAKLGNTKEIYFAKFGIGSIRHLITVSIMSSTVLIAWTIINSIILQLTTPTAIDINNVLDNITPLIIACMVFVVFFFSLFYWNSFLAKSAVYELGIEDSEGKEIVKDEDFEFQFSTIVKGTFIISVLANISSFIYLYKTATLEKLIAYYMPIIQISMLIVIFFAVQLSLVYRMWVFSRKEAIKDLIRQKISSMKQMS